MVKFFITQMWERLSIYDLKSRFSKKLMKLTMEKLRTVTSQKRTPKVKSNDKSLTEGKIIATFITDNGQYL